MTDTTSSEISFDIDSDSSINSDKSDNKSNNNIPEDLSNIGILDPKGKNKNPLTNEDYSDNYKKLGKIWSKYPAYKDPDKIIQDIKDNQVTLVISGTGSGKTVLFPKYVLHSLKYTSNIAITLPKKMIAKSAAEFSAETLDVKVGDSVGYQYRGSDRSAKSERTKLLYCTDGTMVSRLISDPLLSDFDAVIIDEAHERKVNIDFLLYLLRNVLEKRPEFRLVIMSATIDKTLFKKYFDKFTFKVVEIGGKTNYPIESIFLKNRLNIKNNEYLKKGVEIIKTLIKDIRDSKSKDSAIGILFFVTSVSETKDICELISKAEPDSNVCISVYSGMHEDQEKLATDNEYFVKEIGTGSSKIKLVIATNVAESSLTIEGIKYVIDSGLELSSRYDTVNRVNILEKGLITHAQAKQRMGRTGRTGPGICYHLYLEEDFDSIMERFPVPAIRSESITNEILRLLNMEVIGNVSNLKKVLNNFIEPPNDKSVESDLQYLEKLGAIDKSSLTELGNAIVDLQLEPEEAKTVIMSYRLFVFREVIAIIALSQRIKNSISNLFMMPTIDDEEDKSDNKSDKKRSEFLEKKFDKSKKDFDNIYGDLIALLKIFYKYEELREANRKEKTDKSRKDLNDWLYSKFLKRDVLDSAYNSYLRYKRMLRPKLSKLQKETSLIPRTDKEVIDVNSTYKILASFMYGYESNIINIKNKKTELNFIDKNNKSYREKIEVDSSSFIDLSKTNSKSKDVLYSTLFKFGDRPVKAKITTYTSDKSSDILKQINK